MNENHPIDDLMKTAMNSIKEMIDVDTIVGEPIKTANDILIIPISKVGFGFASGGSEFCTNGFNEHKKKDREEDTSCKFPFGGGTGAGISISPVAFVIVEEKSVRILPMEHSSNLDKILDFVPDVVKQVNCMCGEKSEKNNNKKKFFKTRQEEKDEDIRDM